MTKGKRSGRRQSCYICTKPATSREHVPPACFFPEHGELPSGQDLRRNLITVPSCDEHNLSKSDDDQYLCAVVLTYFENNRVAQTHFSQKIIPALLRRPAMLHFYQEMRPLNLQGEVAGVFLIDLPRFNTAMGRIACGIYFHHFGRKHTTGPQILNSSVRAVGVEEAPQINAASWEWRVMSDRFLATLPRHGDNQPVFYYQVVEHPTERRAAIRLVFYEGVVVDAHFPVELA